MQHLKVTEEDIQAIIELRNERLTILDSIKQ